MMNKISKYLLALSLALFSSAALCIVTVDVYCFDAVEAGLKNFELHVLRDDATNWSGAFVKYRGAKSAITLVQKDVFSEEISKGRPDQVTTTWSELYRGKITGEYEVMSQGANIYSMTYKNYATHKQVEFLFNPDALEKNGNGCNW